MFERVQQGAIDGVPFEVWRGRDDQDVDVRIPNEWAEAVVFLYASPEDARDSSPDGATGFVVSVPSETTPGAHVYVVTNAHVAIDAPVIRVVSSVGTLYYVYPNANPWKDHPYGDDVAVCLLPNFASPRTIPVSMFVTESLFADLDLGPGDDAFMLGRFVGLDTDQRNTPTLRTGQIAMSTVERIHNERTDLDQESVIVEMRTLTGYSGSPTFVSIPPILYGPYRPPIKEGATKATRRPGTWLLGVEWGNLHRYQRVREKTGEGQDTKYKPLPEKWYVRENSGMSCIVPAWKIMEVLMSDELKDQRSERERVARESIEVSGGAAPTSDEKEAVFTKTEFENALQKVSRRKPLPPDEGTSGT